MNLFQPSQNIFSGWCSSFCMLKFLHARLSRKMSLDFERDRHLSRAYRTLRNKRVSFSFGVRSSLATHRSTSGAETNGPHMYFNFDRSLFQRLSIFKFSVCFLVTPVQVSWFSWSTQDFISLFNLFDIFLCSHRMVESSSKSS